MDDIFKLFGYKGNDIEDYDDLTPEEQETYRTMLDIVETTAVTLEDVKKHVTSMRQAVEHELANHERLDRQDIYLKARLRNYLLMEAVFEKPQKARQMLQNIQMQKKIKKLL